MINWKVRIRNKNFWVAIIPALLLMIQTVMAVFGVNYNFGDIGDKLLAVVNAVFTVLAILGIVTDPTTAGTGDSIRALGYSEPYQDKEPPDADVSYTDTDPELED